MASPMKHASTGALAALVALAVHQLAYLVAYPVAAIRAEQLADHGHLATQWALVTPLAVVGASAFIVRQVRLLGLGRDLNWRTLGLLSGSAYLVQEALEAGLTAHGLSHLVSSPATTIGLLLAPLLSWLVARALRQATELVARLLPPPAAPPYVPTAVRPVRPGDDRRSTDPRHGPRAARAPPRTLAF